MITWTAIVLWLLVFFVLKEANPTGGVAARIGVIVGVALVAIPAIYTTGWLLLPAYGYGYINQCLR